LSLIPLHLKPKIKLYTHFQTLVQSNLDTRGTALVHLWTTTWGERHRKMLMTSKWTFFHILCFCYVRRAGCISHALPSVSHAPPPRPTSSCPIQPDTPHIADTTPSRPTQAPEPHTAPSGFAERALSTAEKSPAPETVTTTKISTSEQAQQGAGPTAAEPEPVAAPASPQVRLFAPRPPTSSSSRSGG